MKGNRLKRLGTACLAGGLLVVMSACSQPVEPDVNLVQQKEDNVRTVSLFSPMEKTDPDADNVARNAADKTIRMAEEQWITIPIRRRIIRIRRMMMWLLTEPAMMWMIYTC